MTFPDQLVELHFGRSFNRYLVEITSEVENVRKGIFRSGLIILTESRPLFDLLFEWMSIYDSNHFLLRRFCCKKLKGNAPKGSPVRSVFQGSLETVALPPNLECLTSLGPDIFGHQVKSCVSTVLLLLLLLLYIICCVVNWEKVAYNCTNSGKSNIAIAGILLITPSSIGNTVHPREN